MRKRLRANAVLAVCCASVLMTGCGPALYKDVSNPVPVEGPLGGNWLLVGSLPQTQGGYGLTITLDEFGNTVTGRPTVSFDCSAGGPEFPGVNVNVGQGTLGADGGFTLSSATITNAGPTDYGMSIEALNSTTNPAGWSGNFTNEYASTDCMVPTAGMFTATPISLLNGTYTGTVSLTSSSPTPTAATVQLSLQQGGTDPSTNSYSYGIVNGTITVQGVPCLSSGESIADTPSTMNGGETTLVFAMNDGSTWTLEALVDDPAILNMSVYSFAIVGGSCGFNAGSVGSMLTKQ